MNTAQIARLWSLVGLFVLQFFTIIAIDSSAHNAAVPVGGVAGVYNTGSVSSVYDEVGFSFLLIVATAIIGAFVVYRYKHPLVKPQEPIKAQPGPRDF